MTDKELEKYIGKEVELEHNYFGTIQGKFGFGKIPFHTKYFCEPLKVTKKDNWGTNFFAADSVKSIKELKQC